MTNIEISIKQRLDKMSILSLARRLILACALILFASQVSIGQSPLLKFYADRRNLADYAMFAHFGEEYNDTGARLLTEWYHRNMRIHTNLLNIIEPGDRVFVVSGRSNT